MFNNVTLSVPNYDSLLIGWDSQELQSGVAFNGGDSDYCAGEAARTNMIDNDNWTISDGDYDCTQPEIEVSGMGVSIPNGDTSPSASDGTDFGILPSKSSPITHTFTISNTGYTALDLSGIPPIDLAEGTHFQATIQSVSLSIPSGTAVTFQIIFDPQFYGKFTDTVTIESNDMNEGNYTFIISGDKSYPIYLPLVIK
jgi:hypothetical protein